MANYIDPLANAELQRTLAFARARETYPGLRGELLLEICEAAWERSAGDPSDGGALARFESALDLIARQYRIGGGRLSVSEVAQTAIPATALNPYMRAGAKRIAEDARAAENAAAVPVNPTFGDRLARVPKLAPAPLGIGLAASVFGVAAAAQAGVLPDTPITPSHHTTAQSDSASGGTAKKSGGNPAPIAPAATSPGPDSFLAASHAASQADPGEWQAPKQGNGATNAVAARSSLASPGSVSAPASVEAVPTATAVPAGGTASAPAAYATAPAAEVAPAPQPEPAPAPKPSRPAITIDLNGGGVQVNTGKDDDDQGDNDQRGDDDQQTPPTDQKPDVKPTVDTDGVSGVIQVVDPATGKKVSAILVDGVPHIVDVPNVGGPDQTDPAAGQTDPSTGQTDTDDGNGEPVGVDDETTDDGTTDPIGDSTGDEESGDATNEPPPTDDGTNEEQGATPPTTDPNAAAHSATPDPAAAPATPAPAAPAAPAPATPAPAPATPAPTTPAAPATPAPTTPAAPATPAPATPAAAPATPAPATPAPTTPAAATTPAPATPTPGA